MGSNKDMDLELRKMNQQVLEIKVTEREIKTMQHQLGQELNNPGASWLNTWSIIPLLVMSVLNLTW